MFDPPKTRAEARKRTYGHSLWGKSKFNPARCAYEVATDTRAPNYLQCNRKPGHGPDGLYCKQHDPATIAARRAEREKIYHAKLERAHLPYRERERAIALLKRAVRAMRGEGLRITDVRDEIENFLESL